MVFIIIAGLVLVILIIAKITNPFSKFSIVHRPFIADPEDQTIIGIDNNHKIIVRRNKFWKLFAWVKSGVYILESRYISSPRSKSTTVDGIIKDIHKLRYNPDKLLLISGDHFVSLYPRNLGVFYYPMLDSSIPSDNEDWENRQLVYLQTVAFALGVFTKQKQLATTLVPTGRHGVTCINAYAYPSDSLYGILYALAALNGLESAQPYSYAKSLHELKTLKVSATLLKDYKTTLRLLYLQYRLKVYDEKTGLIKSGVHLSGAKDITRRNCAFYDNVIFWKTTELAQKLNLIRQNKGWLSDYKKRIIKTFWLPEAGYFLEDLSDEGLKYRYYSSDWLVVLFSEFLKPENKREQQYFIRSISYIEKHKIDQPFAIMYQQDRRAHRQYLVTRLAVASYGGNSIWSFWGMEYIKVLLQLYRSTNDGLYLKKADYHIRKYKQAIIKNGGFPEVYNSQGDLLETPLYRSIRQTGWVIGFEQVLAIRCTLGP